MGRFGVGKSNLKLGGDEVCYLSAAVSDIRLPSSIMMKGSSAIGHLTLLELGHATVRMRDERVQVMGRMANVDVTMQSGVAAVQSVHLRAVSALRRSLCGY